MRKKSRCLYCKRLHSRIRLCNVRGKANVRKVDKVPAGIDDVAAHAGVSTATVSRALRGLPNVSESTRRRVIEAAQALDYAISPSASRLASGTTRSISVVMPYVGRWFFGQVLEGIEGVLREAGYDVLLFALPDEDAQRDFFERMPLKRRVDAVIVLTLAMTADQEEKLRELELRMATVGDPLGGVFSVGIDDAAAARSATRHLIHLGHTRIAMIGGDVNGLSRFTAPLERQRGFREAMADAGIPVLPGFEVDGEFTVPGGASAMAQLMSLEEAPSAVFAQSDEMAAGAIQTMRKMGLRCPEDVSIVGFDDHELASILDLTTIAQPVQEQGQLAARSILGALAGKELDSDERLQVPTRLIVRSSTCPPRTTPSPRGSAGSTPTRRPTTGDKK